MTTGVIVVTHGGGGQAMLEAAERVVGPLPRVTTVEVAAGEPAAEVERRIEAAVQAVGTEAVVFLVDLSGSTPANLCGRLGGREFAVVSGMNLPMLFKLSTADREHGPMHLAEELASTGQKSILVRGQGSHGRR
jgi:mannose/fructose-specific phosphotransferase system component IIA